jgi:hypothetical protein
MKQRAPFSKGRIPEPQASNGFVRDLVTEVEAAAKRLGLIVTYHVKNYEHYIAVRIPTMEELDAMPGCSVCGKTASEHDLESCRREYED